MPSFGHTPLESGCFGLNDDDAIYAKNCHSPRVPYPVARHSPLGVPFTSGGFVQHLSTFFNPHSFVLIEISPFLGGLDFFRLAVYSASI